MAEPSRADQVTKLYDLIAGYHATHLVEIARALGVWEAITAQPGISAAALATALGTDAFYTEVLCRTAFAFELLEREGDGWRMGPQLDEILGRPDSTFYLGGAARVHQLVGADYADYVRRFRTGARVPYQEHGAEFMREIAEGLKALPRIFTDFVLPSMPALRARLEGAERLLDVGCGGGWALVQLAERYPRLRCVGVDVEPYSVGLANELVAARGLAARCEARTIGVEKLGEDGVYDVATSFLVIHEIDPALKATAIRGVATALRPGGAFVVFDETYPETDAALRRMPSRFAALAQWFELTWGNRVNTRTELLALGADAGLALAEETTFSRFSIVVLTKT